MTQTTPTEQTTQAHSIAFNVGRSAAASGIALEHSALRNLTPESQQYRDYIAGYDFEEAQREIIK
jgi:hypothetical protein